MQERTLHFPAMVISFRIGEGPHFWLSRHRTDDDGLVPAAAEEGQACSRTAAAKI
jgi:hypothetical protein